MLAAALIAGCGASSERAPTTHQADAGEPVEIAGQKDFETNVLERSHSSPVAVMFTAPWSGPDRVMRPILENVISGRSDLDLAIVDVDANLKVAQTYEVLSIPTVAVFVDGEPARRIVGALPEGRLTRQLDAALRGAED
jgi:thioredoxin-like negative regulator of GroEL